MVGVGRGVFLGGRGVLVVVIWGGFVVGRVVLVAVFWGGWWVVEFGCFVDWSEGGIGGCGCWFGGFWGLSVGVLVGFGFCGLGFWCFVVMVTVRVWLVLGFWGWFWWLSCGFVC